MKLSRTSAFSDELKPVGNANHVWPSQPAIVMAALVAAIHAFSRQKTGMSEPEPRGTSPA
jgi:hypothetical protein